MTRTLDILLVEGHAGRGVAAEGDLAAAGHRVHRCHDAGTPGFPCRGITDPDGCALDHHVDVALVVDDDGGDPVEVLEGGVRCALRGGIPVVVEATAALAPLSPWASRGVIAGDVVGACTAAADDAVRAIGHDVLAGIADRAQRLGLDPASCRCRAEPRPDRLLVTIEVDAVVDRATAQALGVRAFDVLRGRPHLDASRIDVAVRPRPGGDRPARS